MESNQDSLKPTDSRMDAILACLPEGSDIRELIVSLQGCVEDSLDVPVHCLIATSTSSNIVRKFSLYFDLKHKQRLSLFEESQTQRLLDTLTEFATHQCIVSDKSFAIEYYKKMNPEQSKITEKDVASFQVPYIHERVNNPFYLTSDQFTLIQESLIGKDKRCAKEGSALRLVIKSVLKLEELMQSTAVSDKIETTLVQCDDSTMDQIKSFFHLLLSHVHIFAQTSTLTPVQAETMVTTITKVIDDVKQTVGVSLDDSSSSQHMIQVNHLLDSLRAKYEEDMPSAEEKNETNAEDIEIMPAPMSSVTPVVEESPNAGDIEIVSMEDVSLDDDEKEETEETKQEEEDGDEKNEEEQDGNQEEGTSFFSFLSSAPAENEKDVESGSPEEVNEEGEDEDNTQTESNVENDEEEQAPSFGSDSPSMQNDLDAADMEEDGEDVSIQFIDTQNPVSISTEKESTVSSVENENDDDISSMRSLLNDSLSSGDSAPFSSPSAPVEVSSSSIDSSLSPSQSSHPLLQKVYGGNSTAPAKKPKSVRRSRQQKQSRARSLRRRNRRSK